MKDYFANIIPRGVAGGAGVAPINNILSNSMLAIDSLTTPSIKKDVTACSSQTNNNVAAPPATHLEGAKKAGVSAKNHYNSIGVTPVTLVTPQKHDTSYVLEICEHYQERAAIIEYDGNLPRHEAERRAYQETFVYFMAKTAPELIAQFENMIFSKKEVLQ